jgi:hypothetical protein
MLACSFLMSARLNELPWYLFSVKCPFGYFCLVLCANCKSWPIFEGGSVFQFLATSPLPAQEGKPVTRSTLWEAVHPVERDEVRVSVRIQSILPGGAATVQARFDSTSWDQRFAYPTNSTSGKHWRSMNLVGNGCTWENPTLWPGSLQAG